MPVATSTAILVAAAVTAGTTAYFGKENLDNARDAKNKQQDLENQRRKQLADEAAAREAAAARAATSGRRVGIGARASLTGGLGFGSGNTQAGLGGGTLFGN